MEELQKQDQPNTKKNKHNSTWPWILWIILLILVFLTSIVLVGRLNGYSPVDSNTVPLIEDEFNIAVEDEDKVWKTTNEINIFKNIYTDESGKVLVEGENEEKVIAPGTSNSYTFNLKNTGDLKLDYEVIMTPTLKINDEVKTFENFPIMVRVKNSENEYYIGNETTWVSIEELSNFKEERTLEVNNYDYYTLEWKWEETNSDQEDTTIGIEASENDIDLIIEISTNAKVADGVKVNDNKTTNEKTQEGNAIIYIPWIILIILIISIICFIIKKVTNTKEEQENNRGVNNAN